jgi:glutathione S-transferase
MQESMLTLHHCPETRSMRALWLLNELGVPFELHEMPFDLNVTRSAEYLAVHPLGRVPCLSEGEFRLFESGAIAEYLCERFLEQGLGRLTGDPERYEWLQWIHYAETIAVHGAALIQQKVFIKPDDRSPVLNKLETRRLQKAVEVVDQALDGRDYLLASGFSAADVAVGYSLHLGRLVADLSRYPRAEAYYQRLAARPAFEKSRGERAWMPAA